MTDYKINGELFYTQLELMVGYYNQGMLTIDEHNDETTVTWIDPEDPNLMDLIELRETEGRPFKIKERYESLDSQPLW